MTSITDLSTDLIVFSENEESHEDNDNDSLYIHEIDSLSFSVASSDEIKKRSVANIYCSKLDGENSVYDERMGTLQPHIKCVTCNADTKLCTGHSGHIELNVPIIHPLLYNDVLKFLECFCTKCGSLIITNNDIKLQNLTRFKKMNRFRAVHNYIQKSKISYCKVCNEKRDNYCVKDGKFYKYIDSKDERVFLTTEEIENTLGNIKNKDLINVGLQDVNVIPINFVCRVLEVMPTCARPYVTSNGGICDDDLTSKYVEIIKVNNKLKKTDLLEKEIQDYTSGLEYHIRTLMDNSKKQAKQINGRSLKCIKERLNGKTGLFRNNLSGKRTDFSARTVIGPDSTLKANEISIPYSFSKKLTFPERVTSYNITKLEKIVNEHKANYVRRNGKTFDLNYCLKSKPYYFTDGFTLKENDLVIRDNKKIDPIKYKNARKVDLKLLSHDIVIRDNVKIKNLKLPEKIIYYPEHTDKIYRNGKLLNKISFEEKEFEIKENDKVVRNGKEINNIVPSKSRYFELQIQDIVERHLIDKDIVLFNRQPSLWDLSMTAKYIKIHKNLTSINSGKEILTIRMNLAQTKAFNADFDGDEMNIFAPQSYESKAELIHISSTEALIKSGQYARLQLSICQDSLTAGYLITQETGKNFRVKIDKDVFYDSISTVEDWDMSFITNKIQHIKKIQKWKQITEPDCVFHGHALVSMLIPDNFEYEYKTTNVLIIRGVMIKGTLNKACLSDGLTSIVHKLEKDCGAKVAIDFVSNFQFLMNNWLRTRGFTIGIKDCIPNDMTEIKNEITKSLIEAQAVTTSEKNLEFREIKIMNALSNANAIGNVISKKSLSLDNNLNIMVLSGAKGSYVNIAQITGFLGQQNIDGGRVQQDCNGRSLPHYNKNYDIEYENNFDENNRQKLELTYEKYGFISGNYITGLNPKETFFHSKSGRQGIIDTSLKTATSGYVQRKLVKKMENYKISYNNFVLDAANNNVLQFNYMDNLDPARTVQENKIQRFTNVENIVKSLNYEYEYNNL